VATFKGKENISHENLSDLGKLLATLRSTAAGIIHLEKYEIQQSIDTFKNLPESQRNSPYILSKLASAVFENGNYKQAEEEYKKLRLIDPFFLHGVEMYSTSLWHLKKERELCSLAKDLLALSKVDHRIWCVAGNSFSLLKQHNNAIKCFKRSVSLDPSSYYAFTLLGHENIIIENFEQAIDCFKNALHINGRHYNAYYGLGIIYLKQEKYQLAEFYFRQAVAINTNNPVLHCNHGMVSDIKLRHFLV
jgi:anaphase-promoting complex subunit 3